MIHPMLKACISDFVLRGRTDFGANLPPTARRDYLRAVTERYDRRYGKQLRGETQRWECPTCGYAWEWTPPEAAVSVMRRIHDHVERGHTEVSWETRSNEYVPVIQEGIQ